MLAAGSAHPAGATPGSDRPGRTMLIAEVTEVGGSPGTQGAIIDPDDDEVRPSSREV